MNSKQARSILFDFIAGDERDYKKAFLSIAKSHPIIAARSIIPETEEEKAERFVLNSYHENGRDKIATIKDLRRFNGSSLKDAVNFFNSVMQKHNLGD